MTGINHVLTGALLVSSVSEPAIALPVAFVSHFVLDMMPHFGVDKDNPHRVLDRIWLIDAVAITGFLLLLFLSDVQNKLLILAGGAVALSPDFVWVYRFVVMERFGKKPPVKVRGKFNHMHASIQTREFRRGLIVEVPVLAFLIWLVAGSIF